MLYVLLALILGYLALQWAVSRELKEIIRNTQSPRQASWEHLP